MKQKIIITNKTGLHARPASIFVQSAAKFASQIYICKGDKRVNGKSILNVLSLGISKGSEIILEIEGTDQELAMHELTALLASNFGEEENL